MDNKECERRLTIVYARMGVCVCVCCVCMCVYVYVCVFMCMYMCLCVCMFVYVFMYVCVSTRVCVFVFVDYLSRETDILGRRDRNLSDDHRFETNTRIVVITRSINFMDIVSEHSK